MNVEAFERELPKFLERADTAEVARALVQVRNARRSLGDIERELETELAENRFESKVTTVSGVGTFEVRRGSVRKSWDSDGLVSLLVRRALDPEGTGEIPGNPFAIAERIRDALTECAPFTPSMGWRVTALRARGVDVDDYCATSPGRVSVQIVAESDIDTAADDARVQHEAALDRADPGLDLNPGEPW